MLGAERHRYTIVFLVEGKTAFEICWLGCKQRKGYILRIAREENDKMRFIKIHVVSLFSLTHNWTTTK
jgi:hypothetical protein